MELLRFKCESVTVTAADFDTLRYVATMLKASEVVEKFLYTGAEPLTKTQLKQLPKAAREKLVYGESGGDIEAFLENLYLLEDPRS